jgi:hypothetical protein
MEEERIESSTKERERSKVLHEITQGHLLQIDAARLPGHHRSFRQIGTPRLTFQAGRLLLPSAHC